MKQSLYCDYVQNLHSIRKFLEMTKKYSNMVITKSIQVICCIHI